MNYFNYAIKCIIRNFIYKIMKPKVFLPILFGIVCTFLLANYTTVFGYEGNNDYTDKNSTIIMCYDSINQDLLNRLNYYDSTNQVYVDFLNDLKNNNLSYYVYYGASDGSSMISSSYYATQDIFVKFYDNVDKTVAGTVYDVYQGMGTNIAQITGGITDTYCFSGNTLVNFNSQSSFYIPYCLISYKSSVLYGFINNTSQTQTNSIIGAINNQTDAIDNQTTAIDNQTQVIQNTQDFLTDDTVDNSTMTIDTSGMNANTGSVDNFFTNFLNSIQSTFTGFSSDVVTVSFGIPFTNQSIVLRSDVISSHLAGTMFETLITAFWWYIFSSYIIMFIKRMLDWLSTGKMAEKGVSAFIDYLDKENQLINTYMM